MKEKVIQNKRIIILIASIVSIALLVPSFISFFGNPINDGSIINVIIYILLLLSGLIFVLYYITKKDIDKKTLIAPIAVFEAAGLVGSIYSIIRNNSWSAVYFAALYASVLILYLIYYFKGAKILKIALYILLLICIVFNLLDVFNGNNVEFSRLILNLIFIGSLYFIPEGGEQE